MSSNQIERLSKNKVQSNASMISFHGLQYQTKLGHKCQKEQKTILNDISGVFEPGLNAIMGPSGCGKTSLLDLLAKRRDEARWSEWTGSAEWERVPEVLQKFNWVSISWKVSQHPPKNSGLEIF